MLQTSGITCTKALWPGLGVRAEILTDASVKNETGNYFKMSLDNSRRDVAMPNLIRQNKEPGY